MRTYSLTIAGSASSANCAAVRALGSANSIIVTFAFGLPSWFSCCGMPLKSAAVAAAPGAFGALVGADDVGPSSTAVPASVDGVDVRARRSEDADEDQDHGDAERGDADADEDGVSTMEVALHRPELRVAV